MNDSDPQAPQPQPDYSHLLPPGYQTQSFQLQPRTRSQTGAGLVGIGAVLIAIALKFKTVLLVLLNFKWIAILGKLLLSSGSLLATILLWIPFFGLPFAVGFVLLILLHEMGHYVAARAYGLHPSAPVFIPFMGAFVALQGLERNTKMSSLISLAGPAAGALGAFGCYVAGIQTGQPFWFALASITFFLNLFNMLPIPPLDGGWVVAPLFSRSSPVSTLDRWLIGAQYLGLGLVLFVMWHVAAGAVHITRG